MIEDSRPAEQSSGNLSAELFRGIEEGDPAAADKLYSLIGRAVRVKLRGAGDEDGIEDVHHEVFMSVLQAIRSNTLRDPRCLLGYVRTIATRARAGMIGRRVSSRNRDLELLDDTLSLADSRGTPQDEILALEKFRIVRTAMTKLRSRDREVLTRFYFYGETKEDIQQQLGLTHDQFRLLKSRALKQLTITAGGDRGKNTRSPRRYLHT